jgi:stage II sporulation protein M
VNSEEILDLVADRLNLETSQISFRYILFNNLRALLVMLIFGAITLGVGGVLAYMLNIALVGGVLGFAGEIGFSPGMMFVVGILPHGIFEITAIVLASAAILQMGVLLVTPDPERTIGQVFVESIADWSKVMAAFGIPLLILAAVIESNVTPQLIISFLK